MMTFDGPVALLDASPTAMVVAARCAAVGLSVVRSDGDVASACLVLGGDVEHLSAAAPDAVVATTDPWQSVTEMAARLARPAHLVAGLVHLAAPSAPGLFEIVRGVRTADATAVALLAFAEALGVPAVEVPDRPGFLVRRLLVAYLNQVVQALDDGIAPAAEIDAAVELGLGHPVGPLRLIDALGIDELVRAGTLLHAELPQGSFAPPPLLARMAVAGASFREEEQ